MANCVCYSPFSMHRLLAYAVYVLIDIYNIRIVNRIVFAERIYNQC